MSEVTQKPNKKIASPNEVVCISTSSSDIEFKVNFPEENPEDCVEDITYTMKHINLFDGIVQ